MREIPRISEAEWEVMRVLWSKSPLTANQIIEALAESRQWKPNTVRTLISRLVKKKVIGFQDVNRIYYYHPLVSQEECLKVENRSFLARVYGGALKPMLVSFLQDEELSAQEIEELKRLLDGKKG